METTALNSLRFSELADAYGGDIRRWPEAELAMASALLRAEPERTAAIIADAAALDALLDASPDFVTSAALRDAIIASAPRQRRPAFGRRWTGVGLGAGLIAASVAGVLSGFAAAPIAASHLHRPTADAANEASQLLGEPSEASEG